MADEAREEKFMLDGQTILEHRDAFVAGGENREKEMTILRVRSTHW